MTVKSYDQYYKTIDYNRKVLSALASVINYDHKCDASISRVIIYDRKHIYDTGHCQGEYFSDIFSLSVPAGTGVKPLILGSQVDGSTTAPPRLALVVHT
jgi:hypothetical protein